MPISVPNSSSVSASFRRLLKRLESLRRKINSAASHETKSGDYDAAKNWMEVGRTITDFRDRADAFTREWKALVKGIRNSNKNAVGRAHSVGSSSASHKRPFVWRFCVPILKLVAGRGGSASSEEVMSDLEQSLGNELTERDQSVSPRSGLPRWHAGIKKAYKQCQREGWIEHRRDGVWKSTPKGKAIVEREE